MYLYFLFGFLTPVLFINPLTKRESSISFMHFVAILSFTITFIPVVVFSCALLNIPLTKRAQDIFIMGVGCSIILTLCLTNYQVWDYINPAIKSIARNIKIATINYIYPATKFTVLKIIIPAAKFSTLKSIQFFKFLIALATNKKIEPEAKNETVKEKPQEDIKQEEPIKPMTRKEKSVQDVLDKLDRF